MMELIFSTSKLVHYLNHSCSPLILQLMYCAARDLGKEKIVCVRALSGPRTTCSVGGCCILNLDLRQILTQVNTDGGSTQII